MYGEVVVVQSYPGIAIGVNATSGKELWSSNADLQCWRELLPSTASTYLRQSHIASPRVGSDGVAVFAMCSEVSAFRAVTGERLWTVAAGSLVVSTPALVDNRVVWCTTTGIVTAAERVSGAVVWSTRPGPAGVGMQSSPTISADGMVVFVVSDAGVVYQMWAESGALVSSTPTARPGQTPITTPAGWPASVSLESRGDALIGGCYNLTSTPSMGQPLGSLGWRIECGYQSLSRGWSVLSATIPGYDAETGFDPAVHGSSVTKAGSIVSSAASGASYIVFTRFQGVLAPAVRVQVVVAFNTTTGDVLWSNAFPLASSWGDGSGSDMPFADAGVALGSDGTLVFGSLDGTVYALRDCAAGTGDAPYNAQTNQGPFRCGSCFRPTYNDGRFRQCQLCPAGRYGLLCHGILRLDQWQARVFEW
jgi:outer membrane protein assembly factor BamB